MTSSDHTILDIRDLSFAYAGNDVLSDFSLSVMEGERIILKGPSGCGKSTLLRLIAGLESPKHGTIQIGGEIATRGKKIMMPLHERRISMVFQDFGLWPHLSVYRNLLIGLDKGKGSRKEKRQRIEAIAELMGLASLLKRKPSRLSAGQQQRVALARALLCDAKLLLLDEAFNSLHTELRTELLELTRQHVESHGITLIMVTHQQDEHSLMGEHRVVEL